MLQVESLLGYVLAAGEAPPEPVPTATRRHGPVTPPVAVSPRRDVTSVSPNARRVAAELGVDLAGLKGTGPGGRITEADVRAAREDGVR
jgi:pyruvate dehydrogenase E2 component (dihydrolipoamide acetyltransferase)